jgi:hypothetical protein
MDWQLFLDQKILTDIRLILVSSYFYTKKTTVLAPGIKPALDTGNSNFYSFPMFSSDSNLIRPLHFAENQFLQVLIDNFSLERTDAGVTLGVRFDENTQAISTRQAKYLLLDSMGDYYREKKGEYQSRLDSFFFGGKESSFSYNDERFPFRFASGGTLPIVSISHQSYYCFFYRDIFPIGWNIANGGCESRGELHNPFRTIERELCEELIVLNPVYKKRYIFERVKNKLVDGLDFEVAEDIWEKKLAQFDIRNFAELMLPIKWIDGPDTVSVTFDNLPVLVTKGYFLNINAEDFGIETDKIAHINLDPFDILMSGETLAGRQFNTPIGLFDVNRFTEESIESGAEMLPDKFYFNAVSYDGSCFKEITDSEIMPYIGRYRSKEEHKQWDATGKRFGLCPVTKQILKRYIPLKKYGESVKDCVFDIFISFGEDDRRFAAIVFDFLVKRKKRVFMRPREMTHDDWMNIDHALNTSHTLVAVGSSRHTLTEHSASYEYRTFHRDLAFGKKGNKAHLLSFVSGLNKQDLPPPLCHFKTMSCDSHGVPAALSELASIV